MTVVNGEIVKSGEPLAVTRPTREIRVVEDSSAVANIMDTARFEHIQRVAKLMATSSLLPNHLRFVRGKDSNGELAPEVQAANCFRVVNQALRWGFDPFAIVDETYMVGGKLGYQGKLVAAVVNAKAGLKSRLRYEFTGQGANLTVRVVGVFQGETEERDIFLRVADAQTDNQMWRKDPEQKLIYSGVVKWARRHCPEVVMGVITDDDLERMALNDEKPRGHNLNERLRATVIEKAEPAPAIAAPATELAPPETHTTPPTPEQSGASEPVSPTGGGAGVGQGEDQQEAQVTVTLSPNARAACEKWSTFAEWASLMAGDQGIGESKAAEMVGAYNLKHDVKSGKSSAVQNRVALAEAIVNQGFADAVAG